MNPNYEYDTWKEPLFLSGRLGKSHRKDIYNRDMKMGYNLFFLLQVHTAFLEQERAT